MAQIILTEEECIEMFYNALCNGMTAIGDYGIELDWDQDEYDMAKYQLTNPCYEDVLIQMLKNGGKIQVTDTEGGEDSEYNVTITLKDVIERVPKAPMRHLVDMLSEKDDATTADVILQTVFYEEVIFG